MNIPRDTEPLGTVLVTGGAGFIGSHAVLQLVEQGFRCVIVDNLSNSSPECVKRMKTLSGKPEFILFHQVDIQNMEALEKVFQTYPQFVACIHFAGLKAVGESMQEPLWYYSHNLSITFNLMQLLEKFSCRNIIFSSSATVYGDAEPPYLESSETGSRITNNYGRTKHVIELLLRDVYNAGCKTGKLSVTILRYFNPVGAHPSGMIGEDPKGLPNNLVPFITQVMVGRRPHLSLFGNDFPTPDGTGVRDYIHVVDLAAGHVKALLKMLDTTKVSYNVYNLGSGNGISVLQVIHAMEKVSGMTIPYKVEPRREGDTAASYANSDKAFEELGWKCTKSLEDMCADTWRWQSQNPQGYDQIDLNNVKGV